MKKIINSLFVVYSLAIFSMSDDTREVAQGDNPHFTQFALKQYPSCPLYKKLNTNIDESYKAIKKNYRSWTGPRYLADIALASLGLTARNTEFYDIKNVWARSHEIKTDYYQDVVTDLLSKKQIENFHGGTLAYESFNSELKDSRESKIIFKKGTQHITIKTTGSFSTYDSPVSSSLACDLKNIRKFLFYYEIGHARGHDQAQLQKSFDVVGLTTQLFNQQTMINDQQARLDQYESNRKECERLLHLSNEAIDKVKVQCNRLENVINTYGTTLGEQYESNKKESDPDLHLHTNVIHALELKCNKLMIYKNVILPLGILSAFSAGFVTRHLWNY